MSASSYSSPAEADVVTPDDRRTLLRNRISWGAVFAGVVTAMVAQMLLHMLGIGIGASSLDAINTGDNPTAGGFSMIAAAWLTVSGIVASLLGGMVAGRLSGTSDKGTARWHGFTSWCAATLVMAYLVTSAAGGIIGGTASALGSTVGAIGRGAATAASGAAQATDGDALKSQVQRLVSPNDAQTVQANIADYIRASVSGDKAAADTARDQAVDGLARTANVSQDEARTRLQAAEQQARAAAEQAKAKAQQAADATRKGVATAGIFGFVALALGAVAAFLGGGMGAPRNEGAMMVSRRD